MGDSTGSGAPFLVCRAGTVLCALPLPHVIETMRPLPIRPLAGAPPLVRGLSIIRGAATPVVDAGALLDLPDAGGPGRFVTLRAGDRVVALAVEAVVGVRDLDAVPLGALPPLAGRIRDDVMERIGTLDADLLVVLRDGRLVPQTVWDALDDEASTP